MEDIQIDYQNLLNNIIENIKAHASAEARYNPKNDKIMIGFLNLCDKILQIRPNLGMNIQSFAKYIFDTCLFCKQPENLLDEHFDFETIQKNGVYEFNPSFYVKCKTPDSRKTAYRILISLVKSNKDILL